MITMRKSCNSWVSFSFLYEYGAPLKRSFQINRPTNSQTKKCKVSGIFKLQYPFFSRVPSFKNATWVFQNACVISNSNWIEWSTIQEVIARVISKSDKREARGRFGITSTITPWIVLRSVQLLINRICNKLWSGVNNVFWEVLLSENICSAFQNYWKLCETLRKSH